ncbi:hypothetical protein DV096_18830 [Bradymonadaceae bacterium TMQ3]|nr:hypothetical protein DV096_18830 [Bradymonadaceae bacterium TMQ3]TXC74561.1 hypothetical protein FRC91_15725 [Bradymonadales bacterium TMQ1]
MGVAVLCLLTALCMPQGAEALELGGLEEVEVGARAGASFGWLYRPEDPVGAPTLLYGTAFRGTGFVVGPTARAALWKGSGAKLSARLELLYGFQSGKGFAEDVERGARIDAVLRAHSLRLPVMVELSNAWDAGGLSLAAGPELVLGVASNATIDQDGRQSEMQTRAPSYVGAAMALGYTLNRGALTIPVELNATWNPFVAESTFERFEGYQSFAQPGRYTAAFNWQLMLSVGVRLSLD